MPHYISGLVAEKSILQSFSKEHSLCGPIKLHVDFLSFLPIDDDDLDSIFPDGQQFVAEFQYLVSIQKY